MLQYLLQKLISEELYAALFYEAAANMLLCKGFKSEAKEYRDIAREELEHVEELTELVYKFNLQADFTITDTRNVSTTNWKTVEDLVNFAIVLEQEAINSYIDAISKVDPINTSVIEVFNHILEEEREHKIDFEQMKSDFIKGDIRDFKCSIQSGSSCNTSQALVHFIKNYFI